MKNVFVTRHKYHIVRSLPGCTVRQEGANGTVIETTVPADEDTPVFAHSGRWSVDGDENVTVTEVFKLAPVVGGSGGGGLPKTNYLIYNSDYTEVSGNLDNLENGYYMFYKTALTSWDIALPSLTDGTYMFNGCTALTSWDVALPSLTNGLRMFNGCTALTSWDIALPSLTNGSYMFNSCATFTSWDIALPSLTNGTYMFNSCRNLTTFTADLPALTNGSNMFSDNPSFTTFTADLPSLTNGSAMFRGCQLNKESALRVLNSIPAYTSGSHSLTIGIHVDHQSDEEVLAAIDAAKAKGWTLTVQWNGTATAA